MSNHAAFEQIYDDGQGLEGEIHSRVFPVHGRLRCTFCQACLMAESAEGFARTATCNKLQS
jgi:hypothetical protein